MIQTLTIHDLEKDVPGKAEVKWLNIVWSMVILNKAPHNWLESVLSSEFYNRLLCKFYANLFEFFFTLSTKNPKDLSSYLTKNDALTRILFDLEPFFL